MRSHRPTRQSFCVFEPPEKRGDGVFGGSELEKVDTVASTFFWLPSGWCLL